MRALYINLDRAPERSAWIEAQAKSLGIAIERLSAIDGSAAGLLSTKGLSASALACFQSHRKAWSTIAAGSDPFGAIFEDDAHLSPDLPQFLSDASWIPADADIIHLGRSRERCVVINRSIKALDRDLYRTVTENSGGEGYILSRSAAQRLVNEFTDISEEFDQPLFNDNVLGLRIYKIIPALCIQDQFVEHPKFGGQIEREPRQKSRGIPVLREVTRLAVKLKRAIPKALGLPAPVRIKVSYR